jgi:predicted acyl esterase
LRSRRPSVTEGVEEYPEGSEGPEREPGAIDYFVSRGYAVAQHHVRGTGSSGGCLEQTAENQISDGALVVEHLATKTPWGDGNVGMYGISYDAETQISVVGLGDPAKTRYLKAIVPAATVGGQYEYSNFDGVPYQGQAILSNTAYLALTTVPGTSRVDFFAARLGCQGELFAGSADTSGDMTDFWARREYRPGAPNVRAATLFVHGLADFNVDTITAAGFYDRLPAATPKKGLFGVWNHAFPHNHGSVRPEWERTDWYPMVLSWFDRYLKGADTGVESWPDVQVQGTDGQWREEPMFPTTGGPVGQLALSTDGTLGAASPSGAGVQLREAEADLATFTTPPVSQPLHLTGQPVLDLRVTTSSPDGHLAARIDVLDANGTAIPNARTDGFRSLRHLDPLTEGRFAQKQGKPAPTNTPIPVRLRFQPTDLRVPAGGKLRVRLGTGGNFNALPSGGTSVITVLTSCEQTSALRFLMPRATQRQLDVREEDEGGQALGDVAERQEDSTGAGLATAPVCGRAPERLEELGPERELSGAGGDAGAGAGGGPVAGTAPSSGRPGSTTPAAATPATATRTAAMRLTTRLWARSVRTFLRRGLPLRVRCTRACRLTATARLGRRVVARGTTRLTANRTRTVALKPTSRRARAIVRRASGKRVTITVSAGGQTKRLTLRLRR